MYHSFRTFWNLNNFKLHHLVKSYCGFVGQGRYCVKKYLSVLASQPIVRSGEVSKVRVSNQRGWLVKFWYWCFYPHILIDLVVYHTHVRRNGFAKQNLSKSGYMGSVKQSYLNLVRIWNEGCLFSDACSYFFLQTILTDFMFKTCIILCYIPLLFDLYSATGVNE